MEEAITKAIPVIISTLIGGGVLGLLLLATKSILKWLLAQQNHIVEKQLEASDERITELGNDFKCHLNKVERSLNNFGQGLTAISESVAGHIQDNAAAHRQIRGRLEVIETEIKKGNGTAS